MNWRIELAHDDRQEGITHRIVNPDGKTVARIYGGLGEEDGAKILRALRSHDLLLAALIGLVERIDEFEPDEWTEEDRIRNDAARAAIAAATT